MSLLLVLPVAAVTLYILLSIPGVQHAIRDRAERELSTLLGTRVEIGKVNIAPFNRLTVNNAVVKDDNGNEALTIGHLGAGVSVTDMLLHGRLVISYTELIDFHINLYRDSTGTPLNIAPILERLKGSGSNETPSFDLAVTTIVIRRGSMDYNVLSSAPADSSRFDVNHISLKGFRADVTIPRLSSGEINFDVKRLAVEERSGLAVKNLRFNFVTDDIETYLSDLRIDIGKTILQFNEIHLGSSLLHLDTSALGTIPLSVNTLPGSVIYPGDFACFLPSLSRFNEKIQLQLDLSGTLDQPDIKRLTLDSGDNRLSVNIAATVGGLMGRKDDLEICFNKLRVYTGGKLPADIIAFADVRPGVRQLLDNAGSVEVMGEGLLGIYPLDAEFTGSVICDAGSVDVDASFSKGDHRAGTEISGKVEFQDFDPDRLLDNPSHRLTRLAGTVSGDVVLSGLDTKGEINVDLDGLIYNGREITGIAAGVEMKSRQIKAELSTSGSNPGMRVGGSCDLSGNLPVIKVVGQIDNVDLSVFNLGGIAGASTGGLTVLADISGDNLDNLTGFVKVSDLYLSDVSRGREFRLDVISAQLERFDEKYEIKLSGDFVEAGVAGDLGLKSVVPSVKRIMAKIYPALFPDVASRPVSVSRDGSLAYSVTLTPDSALCRYFNLPVEVIDDVRLWGMIDNESGKADMNIDAPYLWQKGKLIEQTTMTVSLEEEERKADIEASLQQPSKYGPLTLSVNARGAMNQLATTLSWHIDSPSRIEGALKVDAALRRDTTENASQIGAGIDIRESRIVFNDTVWRVSPATVSLNPGRIEVDDFLVSRPGQQLGITGVVSADSTDVLTVGLTNIDLGYVFETLAINHVTFGGSATGTFYASGLFKDSRRMFTPRLEVKDFSYNGSLLGDAVIASRWDNSTQGIVLDVDITGRDGDLTHALGEIRPIASELDIDFDARHLPVGFLAPFMDAFAEDVSGYASGNARLYGTFHDINLSGRLLAEDFNMKVKFTNTDYTVARDSIVIVPGKIEFNDIVLTDRFGKSARLSGELTHNCFHDASFRFDVSDARDLLCYDLGENSTDYSWYGRVFGTGGVTIRGVPGMINIGVNLATAPGTVFTLRLDDTEDAAEYDFITFHDRDKARKDSIAALDPLPLIIRQLRERREREEDSPPTEYVLDFNLDVTPAANLNLIMDPKGGDKINSVGEGHIRMNYASTGDFKIFGTYTINRGSYNFTLQDIIIKDFQIVEGSYIKFNGNPDAALLDIKATYGVNANLTDLDESFSQDKELNRTNVPVNAVLLVTGDMRQPEIDFDLEFPTLTRDVDRKVRSIVSTEEMMNRQIIYLLALNRFYTPEYMNATRGNELVSVASSTISSQLSSMLGQLSDKWSIAPNFRSDRGDFSDVEVDVALSSHLLNNRLLLNGNFGYRDKSLNNNSFIGDFDIRYLLNRAGTISLKAYNRYNDQNYYLKSALTTQGIGVVFKRDFDSWKEFFSPLKYIFRRKPRVVTAPESSTADEKIEEADSEPASQESSSGEDE